MLSSDTALFHEVRSAWSTEVPSKEVPKSLYKDTGRWWTTQTQIFARILNGTHTQHYALQSRVRYSTLRTTGNSAVLDTPHSIL